MKYVIPLILLFFTITNTTAQNLKEITNINIAAKDAGEGDLYKHKFTNIIYIGLTDGTFQPINKNLKEILAEANDANALKITNLGTPTNPKDAVTKEYVDISNNKAWKLTGNTPTTNANYIGTTNAQDLILKSNSVEKLRLVNNKGQVLINQATTYKDHPLVLRANGNEVLAFEDASGVAKWDWNLLPNGLNFEESGVFNSRLFLKSGGNIGINTTDPQAKLHIAGDLQVNNAFKDKDGDAGISGQILSSTATGTDWVTQNSSKNIYNTSGLLTSNRSLKGQNNDLSFSAINNYSIDSSSLLLTATGNTQINTSAGYTQMWGSSGILFYDNSTFEENLWVKKILRDSQGDRGIAGQILSSTNVGTKWINNSSSNIFISNGTLTSHRTLYGNKNNLYFRGIKRLLFKVTKIENEAETNISNKAPTITSTAATIVNTGTTITNSGTTITNSASITTNSSSTITNSSSTITNIGTTLINNFKNFRTFGENLIQLRSTAGNIQIAGATGIQLQNNTQVTGDLSVSGSYIDSSTSPGATNDILSSTGTGTAWRPLISNDANNSIVIGTDNGIYRKEKTLQLLTSESSGTQAWSQLNNNELVSKLTLTLEEESIVSLDYIFTYTIEKLDKVNNFRGVLVYITGSTTLINQMTSINDLPSHLNGKFSPTLFIADTCSASRKYKLPIGTYSFEMYSFGNTNCKTETNNSISGGWSFDVCATPTGI